MPELPTSPALANEVMPRELAIIDRLQIVVIRRVEVNEIMGIAPLGGYLG